jgi:hypothetical protein
MLSLYEILKASKTGIAPDMWTALSDMNWGGADSGHEVKELTGIPPLSFTADGTPLLDYLISGNTVQNGTPTPSNPVDVNGCGEYDSVSGTYYISISGDTTELIDLHDFDRGTLRCSIVATAYHVNQAPLVNVITQANIPNAMIISIKSATTYQVRFKTNNTEISNDDYVRIAFINKFVKGAIVYDVYTWQKGGNDDKLRNDKEYYVTMDNTNYRYLVVQSNLSPFSMFDYFSIHEVSSVIRFSSYPTTRQIKKLVLDGTENWSEKPCNVGYRFVILITSAMQSDTTIGVRSICTHQILVATGETYNKLRAYTISGTSELIMTLNGDTRLASWKSWLAAQYAADTPVTIWYVLATPETAVVNEPLMKIGGYADTLSMEQAGVSIPTLNGQTVVDVETTLKPSKMYIKYKE